MFGPIYFLCFVFFVFFVLLNMFLAILSDSFGEVKAELARRKNAFEMGAYFKEGYVNLIDRMGLHSRKMDVDEALKMAAEQNYNNKPAIRDFLRKFVATYAICHIWSFLRCYLHFRRNFGEIEVDIFFERFEFDYKRDVANADLEDVQLELGEEEPKPEPKQEPVRLQSSLSP